MQGRLLMVTIPFEEQMSLARDVSFDDERSIIFNNLLASACNTEGACAYANVSHMTYACIDWFVK